LSANPPDPRSSPLEQAIGAEALARYEAALERLRPSDREAIVARIELQQPYDKVAVALNMPSARAAQKRVVRALGRLVAKMHILEGSSSQIAASVSHTPDRTLLGVTSAIADAEPIPWEQFQALGSDETRRQTLRQLRTVAKVAQENRRRMKRPDPRPTSDAKSDVHIRTWGRFILRRKIGEGAFGEVYEAHDPMINTRVALKIAWAPTAERDSSSAALHEARQLARVRHPNVVSVHEVATHGGRVGFTMDFVEGHTLREQVEGQGPLTADEAARIGMEVCSALDAVHSAGVIHRDVKAQNVIRSTDGRIVLMDFGASELLGSANVEWRRQGTPLYLAPELFDGDSGSVASDVYAVGILLYYLVTGGYPVQAATLDDLRAAHHRGDRRRLAVVRPDLPSAFVAVVEQALGREPAGRYQSVSALRHALNTALQQHQVLELSDQTQAIITRLNARAYFSVQGHLLRSAHRRASALTILPVLPEENAPPQVMRTLTRAVVEDETLARSLSEATVAAFGCELERGLLSESRCRFSRIGEFTVVPAGPTVDVRFVAEPSVLERSLQGQQSDDPILAHALQHATLIDAGGMLPVGADITRQVFASAEHLIGHLGIPGLGRALYWAFVAAIYRNLERTGAVALPHVGIFQLRNGNLEFEADRVFMRIIAESVG
jgi:serine/threonine-protein kinase